MEICPWKNDIMCKNTNLECCLVTKPCLALATPWTVACQVPLSMGFLRQEYWSGLTFPPPGDLPDPGIKHTWPALAGRFFTTESPGKPFVYVPGLHI